MFKRQHWMSNYPYCDFVFFTGKEVIDENFNANFNSLKVSNLGFDEAYLYYDREYDLIVSDIGKSILSGVLKYNHHLIWGKKDLQSSNDVDNILNEIGNYTILTISDNCLKCSTDYFGTNKIYYVNNEDFKIVSNRYDLVLMIVNYFKIPTELDEGLVNSYLLYSDISTNQLISNNTLNKIIKVLDVKSNLLLHDGKMIFEHSKIKTDLSRPCCQNEEEYKLLLRKACLDIKENIEIVYNNDRFEKVIVDLTGGLDSRMVFAAMNSINKSKKTEIFTFGSGDDLVCASQLSEAFEYNYCTDYYAIHGIDNKNLDIVSSQKPDDYFSLRDSFVNGTYFEPGDGLTDSNVCLKGAIRLSGGSGEIVSRPYISFNVFNVLKSATCEDIKKYLKKKENKKLLNSCNIANDVSDLVLLIYNVIHNSDFNNDMLKNEELLVQRTRFHFDTQFNNSFRTPIWQPCQSVEAFRCYIQSLSYTNSRRFVFDLIEELDSRVSVFPYVSTKDNNDSSRFGNITKIRMEKNSEADFNYKYMRVEKKYIKCSDAKGCFVNEWKSIDVKKTIIENCEELIKNLQFISNNLNPSFVNLLVDSWNNLKTQGDFSLIYCFFRKIVSIDGILNPIHCSDIDRYMPFEVSFNHHSFIDNDDPVYLHKAAMSISNSDNDSKVLKRYYLKYASLSNINYIINDYAECLIQSTNITDKNKAKQLLFPFMDRGDSQSIRWYARILLDSKDREDFVVGKMLLLYSAELGNKYAKMDYQRLFDPNYD